MTAEQFWLQKWPDDKKQYHWSAIGPDVLAETLAFAEAYANHVNGLIAVRSCVEPDRFSEGIPHKSFKGSY